MNMNTPAMHDMENVTKCTSDDRCNHVIPSLLVRTARSSSTWQVLAAGEVRALQ